MVRERAGIVGPFGHKRKCRVPKDPAPRRPPRYGLETQPVPAEVPTSFSQDNCLKRQFSVILTRREAHYAGKMTKIAPAALAADEKSDCASTLLLVDDHPLYHAGLRSVLQALRPHYRVLSAGDAAAGLAILEVRQDVDLVLIDIVLPGTDGFDAVARYGRACPHVPRVLISGREDAATMRRASSSGASGFVAKSWPIERLLGVIEKVLAGASGFEPLPATPSAANDAHRRCQDLSLRQVEVLTLLAQGKSNKEIARTLDIADRTVRAHLTELFHALGVASRIQAVLQAQQLGIVT